MSKEIKVTVGLECSNVNFKIPKIGGSKSIDQATIGGGVPGMVSIGTSEEDILTTDVSTLGWMYIKNVDPTNFITYGPKSGGSMVGFGKLFPGEEAVMRLLPGITIRAIADTAAVKTQIIILNH